MAIERQEAQGPKRLLCMFLIDENHHNEDKDPWPWGGNIQWARKFKKVQAKKLVKSNK